MRKLYVKYANRVSYIGIIDQFREQTIKYNEGAMEIEWDENFNKFGKTSPSARASNLKQVLVKSAKDLKLMVIGRRGRQRYYLAYNWYNDKQLEFDKPSASQPIDATADQTDVATLIERVENLEKQVDTIFKVVVNHRVDVEAAFESALASLRCLEPEEGEQK